MEAHAVLQKEGFTVRTHATISTLGEAFSPVQNFAAIFSIKINGLQLKTLQFRSWTKLC
jgi:hypothetical protein